MALTLSVPQLEQYQALSAALLSPLAYPDVDAWRGAVTRETRALFHADYTMLALPSERGLSVFSEDVDADVQRQIERAMGEMLGGERAVDPVVRSWLEVQRRRRIEVYSDGVIQRETNEELRRRSAYYNEVLWPARMRHCQELSPLDPEPGAFLTVSHRLPDRNPFGEQGLLLLATLLPGLRAALATLDRLDGGRRALEQALDALAEGAIAFGADGRERHRNPAMARWLAADPEAEVAVTAIGRSTALRLVGDRRARGETVGAGAVGERPVRTRRAQYRVATTVLPPGSGWRDGAVLLTVEAAAPPAGGAPALPPAKEIQERYDLTRREAEVTLLLAEGMSNAEIARRLFLSPHTVRHHGESIFRKLGIRTRKGIALALLRGNATSHDPVTAGER